MERTAKTEDAMPLGFTCPKHGKSATPCVCMTKNKLPWPRSVAGPLWVGITGSGPVQYPKDNPRAEVDQPPAC